MQRKIILNEKDARQEIEDNRTLPSWMENQHALPFNNLSPDEFEILSYLLIKKENSTAKVYYYGKTGDGGRDVFLEKSDGKKELIQCKLYSHNLGSSEVKNEIAKLYWNLYNKKIPVQPDKIILFAVPDLTAPAKDFLLLDKDKWFATVEKILISYLNILTLDQCFVDFIKKWYPEREIQTALDLTNRIQIFPDLLEEFFRIKKVIDEKSLIPIESKLDETQLMVEKILENLEKHQLVSVSSGINNMSESSNALKQMINKAEGQNPFLRFNLDINSEVTTIKVEASNKSVILGTLTFENCEYSERGWKKYASLIKEGRDIELLPGEYHWTWDENFSFPNISDIFPSMTGSLKIGHILPKKEVPIKLVCVKDQIEIFSIDFAYGAVVRMGEDEIELIIYNHNLPCKIGMICNFIEKTGEFWNINRFDVRSVPIEKSIIFYELIDSMVDFASVSIISLEYNLPLFEGIKISKNDPNNNVSFTLDVLKKINKINRKFNINLVFPCEKNMEKELSDIEELIQYIDTGKVKITGSFIVSWSLQQLEALLNQSQSRLIIEYNRAKYTIQDNEIIFEKVYFIIESIEIENHQNLVINLKNSPESNDIYDVNIFIKDGFWTENLPEDCFLKEDY